MKRNEKSAILLIYTGGTIGMKEDPAVQALRPFNFSQILAEVPELGKFAYRIDSYTFDPLIDSSDVEPALWTAYGSSASASIPPAKSVSSRHFWKTTWTTFWM